MNPITLFETLVRTPGNRFRVVFLNVQNDGVARAGTCAVQLGHLN
jgi:hypothetical protein